MTPQPPVETWDEAGSSTISEMALALAALHAAQDEVTLKRLMDEGKVVRAATPERARVKFAEAGRPRVNLAIRPKKRKGKR